MSPHTSIIDTLLAGKMEMMLFKYFTFLELILIFYFFPFELWTENWYLDVLIQI